MTTLPEVFGIAVQHGPEGRGSLPIFWEGGESRLTIPSRHSFREQQGGQETPQHFLDVPLQGHSS